MALGLDQIFDRWREVCERDGNNAPFRCNANAVKVEVGKGQTVPSSPLPGATVVSAQIGADGFAACSERRVTSLSAASTSASQRSRCVSSRR